MFSSRCIKDEESTGLNTKATNNEEDRVMIRVMGR
jgi:hypothetical protein